MIAPTDREGIERIVAAVRASLTDELLKPRWRARKNSPQGRATTGHCFHAAEAVYWLLGGKEAGWVSCRLTPDPARPTEKHWYLRHRDTGLIVDPTADQFPQLPDYVSGRGGGFPTRKNGRAELGPAKAGQIVMDRALALLAASGPVAA